MNPIEIYTDAGRKAGIAAKRRDAGLVRHWSSWLSRAIALEPDNMKESCRSAYRDAYRKEAAPR
jgi:hypothetical protein